MTVYMLRKNERKYVAIVNKEHKDVVQISNGYFFIDFDVRDLNLLIKRLQQLKENYRKKRR